MENGFELGLEAIKAWCDRNDFKYLTNDELGQLGIPTPLGSNFVIRVIPRDERQMITLALPLPVRVAPALRSEINKAVALANSATFMGAWVLNQGKGEIYFRVTLPTLGAEMNDDGFKRILQIIVVSVQGLLPAWKQILEAGAPAEVILPKPGAAPAPTPDA